MDGIPGDNGTRLIGRHRARGKRAVRVMLKRGVSVQIRWSVIAVSVHGDDSWQIAMTGIANTLADNSTVRNTILHRTLNWPRGKLNSSVNMHVEGVVNRVVEGEALRKINSEGGVKIVVLVLALVINLSSTMKLVYEMNRNRVHAVRRNVERGREWI